MGLDFRGFLPRRLMHQAFLRYALLSNYRANDSRYCLWK